MSGAALLHDPVLVRDVRAEAAEPRLEALLEPYMRAWERHGVRFGTRSSDGTLFSAVLREVAPPVGPFPAGGKEHPVVIVSDDALVYRFPHGHPDPRCRGERNARFLDPDGLEERVLGPLDLPGEATVVLDIPRIHPTEGRVFGAVLGRLDRMLSVVARGRRIAVALHNGAYLLPDYLACLGRHGVGHVLRCGEDMPPLLEQLRMPGVLEAGPLVVDVELAGRRHETLPGVAEAVRRALEGGRPLAVCAGERPGRSTLAALLALMTMLNPELAKRSHLKRCAA